MCGLAGLKNGKDATAITFYNQSLETSYDLWPLVARLLILVIRPSQKPML